MITYHNESMEDILEEVKPLSLAHYEESAAYKDTMRFAPDYVRYVQFDSINALCIITIRDDNVLVGYSIDMLFPHMHHKRDLSATKDLVYVKPEYRRGKTVAKLLVYASNELKSRGVKMHNVPARVGTGYGRLLVALGYEHLDNNHCKILGV